MEPEIMSIGYELEGTGETKVEDTVASVDQWTQGLHKELNAKMEEMQLDLQMSPVCRPITKSYSGPQK
jgi:hypothetical protein